MVTSNVLQRVFHIEIGGSRGTVFTLDHAGKQYLITARHLIPDKLENLRCVKIFHDSQWKDFPVNIVGTARDEIDIAVLSPPSQLAPTCSLEPTIGGLGLGQQVYFLGFPMGMVGGGGKINRDFPIPLVKSGVFSGMDSGHPPEKIWIDGHNNPGFSGGPMVFAPIESPRKWQVAGVISGYRLSHFPVYDYNKRQIGIFPENSGIVEVQNIKFAIDLIDDNPIGFPLPNT